MRTAPESARRQVAAGLLTIDVDEQPSVYLLRIAGELDLASVPALDHELKRALASPAEAILLDLDRLTFVDSRGVQCLTKAARSDGKAKRLRAAGVQGDARRIFRLTGLDAILPLVS